MTKLTHLHHEFVECIPEDLEPGVLYVSKRYSTASHLCCCGCGLEVVTPLNPAKWRMTERDGRIYLRPSVGNWSFPCQSHYWIEGGQVRWAGAMTPAQIAAVQARDRFDTLPPPPAVPQPEFWLTVILHRLRIAWANAATKAKKWFGL
jgi:hypothetical protein